MSQFTFGNIDETVTDGYDLAAFLEEFEAAINSDHAGPTAPVYAIQGMTWRDTSGTPHLIKKYDGASWVTTGELNATTHVYKPWSNGAVLGALSGYGVGNGLEVDSSNLRVKLHGSSLARSSDGLKVADKGITVGMIADSTDGGIWTWGADGVAVLLAPGDAGDVLHTAGAGQLPYWDEAASGMEFIGASSLAGVSSVSITFDPSIYKSVQVHLRNIATTAVSIYSSATYIRPLVNSSLVNWSEPSAAAMFLVTQYYTYDGKGGGIVNLYGNTGAVKHANFKGQSYANLVANGNPPTMQGQDVNCALINAGQINGFYINTSYYNASGGPPVWATGAQVALYGMRN